MQATIAADRRPASLGGARLWARLVLSLLVAAVLGFGLGFVTSPAAHMLQPTVKVITAPATNDQSVELKCPTHGALP